MRLRRLHLERGASMKFSVPWSVKGIRQEARESAIEAARRSGVSLDEWLNSVIIQQAVREGVQVHSHADDDDGFQRGELVAVNGRLDDLTRRIEQIMHMGSAAYTPRRVRDESDLDAGAARTMAPPVMPPAMPSRPSPPCLDRADAEIAARQRALNDQPVLTPQQAPPVTMAPPFAPTSATPAAPPHGFAPAPLPAQILSGLEEQLRNITDQIETLRRPGVEQAINALRDELAEIGRSLNDAMPRRAIDAIEKQIAGLTYRIAEDRQAGVDGAALARIERGLAEVRDALRGLMPAENLVGFNDAIAGLAQKIDLIVAQKDPATLAQLESAITTLRGMARSVASNETVNSLATEVQALGQKVEHIAMAGASGDALNNLEHRIAALSDTLAERTLSCGAVPPRLDALVDSLTEKIELIQNARGDSVAFGHLEDRIVKLVEKLDASDSRFGHLEAIERGLADLLVNIEDMKANKDAGALRTAGVDDFKYDIARTQDALEAVHGTLGLVVDRLAAIEKDIRVETRARDEAEMDSDAPIHPVGKLSVRMVNDAQPELPPMPAAAPWQIPAPQLAAPPPQQVAAAARRGSAANRPLIDPDLPPDQPIEPGSGLSHLRANPAARIAASEAALGGAKPFAVAAPGGKSDFIAAARRAAQAAGQEPRGRVPRAASMETNQTGDSSLRTKLMKRVKSLLIAASVIAAVVGSVQIGGNVLKLGNRAKVVNAPNVGAAKTHMAAPTERPVAPLSLAANSGDAPKPQDDGAAVKRPPAAGNPSQELNPAMQGLSSLLNPPLLGSNNDITGAISPPTGNSMPPPAPSTSPAQQHLGKLPTTIGGARLRSAATDGDAAAAYEVGVRFAEGRGVPANPVEAAQWFERAAAKGLAPAQFRYASLLEKGLGVKKDLNKARRLYLAAAAKGNAKAMHNLAVLYAEGIDGKPEYPTAAQWFRKAAEAGISDSQYNLGVLTARGLGAKKDMVESYKWFALAAAQGDREAAKKRDEVAAHLDAQALAAAKQAAAGFKPKRPPDEAVKVAVPPDGWDHASEAPPPKAKPKPSGPLSLGSFTVGKR
jgi:localization factor PodJL